MRGNAATGDLAGELRDLTVGVVEDLVGSHLRDWRIPGTFAAHPVEPDVPADLAFTLGLLWEGGAREVAGTPIDDALEQVLAQVDGRRTHTFFSYRVAETLARFGPFRGNPLTGGWSSEDRADLAVACDSTEWVELLDAGLPRNYAAVLARCELARGRLGMDVDAAVLDRLLARLVGLLEANPLLVLDDSTNRVGRHDIYAADVWLFTEPLAEELGELWGRGARTAVDLVRRVGSPDGSAVTWGRSTGALSVALTIELAALALAERLDDHPGLWAQRARDATATIAGWFDGGLVNAHQHRDTDGYRGPFRRLQMTLDLLGKLAWSANALDGLPEPPTEEPYPDTDDLVRFDDRRPTAAWVHRSGRGRSRSHLVVPLVGATTSDYLAAPRAPGCFEVPVDSELATWVPMVAHRHRRWSPTGVPDRVHHEPGSLQAAWSSLTPTGELDPSAEPDRLEGTCELTWRAAGRGVELDVRLELAAAPWSVGLAVPEVRGRPLRVQVHPRGDTVVHHDLVDTSGIAEWRSHWNELTAVHQLDVQAARSMEWSVRVTPTIRVASTAHGHHFDDRLYAPLVASRRAVSLPSPIGPLGDPSRSLDDVDVFHLHWPEWFAFDDVELHRDLARQLREAGVPVLWTMHNLTPHEKRPEVHDGCYQVWAETADVVAHLSSGGAEQARARYRFHPGARHVVLPHAHFGGLYPTAATPRDDAAAALGLEPAPIRIGVLGAPRRERKVAELLEGVACSGNDRIQVCCWSLGPDDPVPDDPRVAVAEPYRMVDTATYGLRLAACDLLALPFDPDGEMMATGVAADVLGHGLGALRSEWAYLDEVLGDAGILVGHDAATIAAALDGLDESAVAAAQAASVARRDAVSPERIAEQFMALLESLVTRRG